MNKILLANRGEIACRIIRTAKRLGMQTVAVYSDVDAQALHVRLADEAYAIGSTRGYLDINHLISVAQAADVDAIHPGYGFLAENAEFAAACALAGIIFIGPSAKVIQVMGSKRHAKQLMQQAGVPVVPGYHGAKQTPSYLKQQASKIGYPILIKPVSGGGGKGMHVVASEADFNSLLATAKREAKASFADDRVILEKYLTHSRHIEVQIMADQHGNTVHVFERDCSIQRRHQKVIEETPAPHLAKQIKQAMYNAAISAAKAIHYIGAGTIEFLKDEDDQFYFIEMNTRLQVEHPVTEMTTGIDLVEWQLKIAAGETLPYQQNNIQQTGHSIETRIYAEDPNHAFLPATGTLIHAQAPKESQYVRLDTGFSKGDTITPFYDPLMAKLIVWDKTRAKAILRLQQALADYQIAGVTTNLDFLQMILASPAFKTGKYSTNTLDTLLKQLIKPKPPASKLILALATLAILCQRQQRANHL